MNKIVYGTLEITDKNIISGQCNIQHALNGESLAIDTLIFKAWTGQESEQFILVNGDPFITLDRGELVVLTTRIDPTLLSIGTPLLYYFDDELIGKFYIDKINRNNNDTYTFSCISSVGILERNKHYGGIYTGQTVKTVLQDLLLGIDYELDNTLEDLRLYGYLPYDTKRNNLMQIQVSTGLAVKTTPTGKLTITALSKDIKSDIANDNIIVGGKYDRLIPASKILLTEHKYEETDTEDTIYTNDINGSTTIIFKEPYHNLNLTGGTIATSGANYAIVNGVGTVILKGKKYKHITQVLEKGSGIDNVINIDKATLVTLANSNAVLDSLYYVYTLDNIIEQDIIYNNEKCGDLANIVNPYSLENESVFIKGLDITMGGFLKARGKFMVDFIPSQPTMGFSNRILLNSGTQWTVPSGVTKVRAILIGSGQDGLIGLNGAQGTPGGTTKNGNGGLGGKGGLGGASGNILNTTLDVTGGQAINYTIGINGNHTVFGILSSLDGNNASEFIDIYTGDRYAQKGITGVNGGKGSGNDGLGEEVNGYMPGIDGNTTTYNSDYGRITSYGGSGGGASNIANGANGANGYCETNQGKGFANGGQGGTGANGGSGLNATTYGQGGQGGHGGGGGGGGGGAYHPASQYSWQGSGGIGGTGGTGGKGANGCIIIYY